MSGLSLQTAVLFVVVAAFDLLLLREGGGLILVAFTIGLVVAAGGLAWSRRGIERSWWCGFAIAGWSAVLLFWAIDMKPTLVPLALRLDPGLGNEVSLRSLVAFINGIIPLLIQLAGVAGGLIDVAVFAVARGPGERR